MGKLNIAPWDKRKYRLTPYMKVIWALRLRKYTHKEIAEKLGSSPNAIRFTVYRINLKLKRYPDLIDYKEFDFFPDLTNVKRHRGGNG